MGLYYLPFWLEIWYKDYKVQALPRDTRLVLYDLLFILWDKDMQLANDDHAISYYMRLTPEQWIDAKRILINSDLIQLVQQSKFITCHRLGREYERVTSESIEFSDLQSKRAIKGWAKRRQNK